MSKIEDAQALVDAAKAYLKEVKSMEAKSAKAFDAPLSKSQKLQADLNWQGMEVEKALARLHAAAVDCGAADVRDRRAYDAVEFRPSGFHTYRFQPPKPREVSP